MAKPPGNPAVAALGALAIALFLAASFFYAYAGGLHEPQAHEIPFAVIASQPEYSEIADKLGAATGDALAPRRVADRATAIEQIKHRSIYGAIELGNPWHLYIGTAGSAIAAQIIEEAATETAAKAGEQLVTTDAAPLSDRDPDGLIPFYLVVAAVLGGYLSAMFTSAVTGSTRFEFRPGLRHLALFPAFGLAFAIIVMVIAGPGLDALPGSFWALVAIVALIFVTSAAVTLGLLAALGQVAGFLCAITVLVFLGNSSSGGASPHDFLPGFWRALNDVLLNAAGVNAVTDVAYFPDVSLARALLTLAAWLLGGVAVFLMLRPRKAASATQTN